MVSQELVCELGLILQEDYGLKLAPDELCEVANTLVNYFNLLLNIDHGEEGQNG